MQQAPGTKPLSGGKIAQLTKMMRAAQGTSSNNGMEKAKGIPSVASNPNTIYDKYDEAAGKASQAQQDAMRSATSRIPSNGGFGLKSKIDAARKRSEQGTPPLTRPRAIGAAGTRPTNQTMSGAPKTAGLGAAMGGPKMGLGAAMGAKQLGGMGASLGKKVGMKNGGAVGSASKRADGCAVKGKTKGKYL